ncbi:MBL fold metallo-hydrolase [Intestinibacillus sp. Marseille-P6563]|uniref:MBL fold metallo-hydrolase n=1 Tax=Intestinibacillus sp. Marseille-P6563 TaxID=2364792 RepID=UPI000F050182|nr:MBL fold metallo-hydrolase [Intestinibacillus sp. Marseille-P6563]
MRLYTLTENTAISPDFGCEHGLSLYLDTENEGPLLFDMGHTELFLQNARTLGLDIGKVTRAFLSHGHYDHGGGLAAFLRENDHAPVYVHHRAFEPHFSQKPNGIEEIGLDRTLQHHPRLAAAGDVQEVSPNLLLFADVTGTECQSAGCKTLLEREGEQYVPDSFAHEQSLIVYEKGKCILFTGCAHRGVVNLVQKAAEHAGRMPDVVVGGMHLYSPNRGQSEPDELIEEIGRRLEATGARYLTGHCTGPHAYTLLHDMLGDQVGALSAGCCWDIS